MSKDVVELPIMAFDHEKAEWSQAVSPGQNTVCETLTVATFNIWFGEVLMAERYRAIADLLEAHRPDFIALQEVTPEALPLFTNLDWIQSEYYASDAHGDTLGDYGVLLLSRLPLRKIELHSLPSHMGRRLLLAETEINEISLSVGTVHLESLKSSWQTRQIQLETIFMKLMDAQNVVIMGDFNFDPSWPENKLIDPVYQDMWPVLHGDQPGYTEDTRINRLRYVISSGRHHQVRFDRVILKSASWVGASIELLGTEPISPDFSNIFPSDHFGLLCEITCR